MGRATPKVLVFVVLGLMQTGKGDYRIRLKLFNGTGQTRKAGRQMPDQFYGRIFPANRFLWHRNIIFSQLSFHQGGFPLHFNLIHISLQEAGVSLREIFRRNSF